MDGGYLGEVGQRGRVGLGAALPRVERVRICHDKRAKNSITKESEGQAMAKAGVLLLVRWLGLIIT